MIVLVTGAAGFLGKALVARLLLENTKINNKDIDRVIALDINCDVLEPHTKLTKVNGDITDDTILTTAVVDEPEMIFHLASLPGGATEKNYELGFAVNFTASRNLFNKLKDFVSTPILIFSSSIAVYGNALIMDEQASVIDENTHFQPNLSYGAQKLAVEVLLQDFSRRGWIDGRILRLPGIVARPSSASGLLSSFMSDVFWKISQGETFNCPVSKNATSWYMSQKCCVDNLLHAAGLEFSDKNRRRDYTLPILRLSIDEVIDALLVRFGGSKEILVSHVVDNELERTFGRQPNIDTSEAEKAGFKHDRNIEVLITNALNSLN